MAKGKKIYQKKNGSLVERTGKIELEWRVYFFQLERKNLKFQSKPGPVNVGD